MKYVLAGHDMKHAAEEMLLHLLPTETLTRVEHEEEGDICVSSLREENGKATASARVTIGGRAEERTMSAEIEGLDTLAYKRALSTIVKTTIYDAVVPFLDAPPVWGSLTGVRPAKLARGLVERGKTRGEAAVMLRDTYHVSPERTALTIRAAATAMELDQEIGPDDISLYVGIPFCPSRCYYCSFVSSTTAQSGNLIEPYLETLCGEIRETAALVREAGKRVQSIYIGGGTPTTLSSAQMAQLLEAIHTSFDLSRCLEFTVEGGRPDTLDEEKLRVIKAGGATRISINPQTMSDKVLAAVGRRHTARQTIEAFYQAVRAGFDDINMDLIAGLPDDDEEGFADSIRQVLALGPSNITVHTLALKKGAALFSSRAPLPPQEAVAAMLAGAEDALRDNGYEPYYLYRQKYMSGSFENTGWCRPGYTGLYNIYMMEELHTILSLGGGGMNKINLPAEKLARYHNPKIPQDYISRIDTILQQKDEIFSLLRQIREQNP